MKVEKVNELNEAQTPARELLERLGYEHVPRGRLAAEREGERDVLLRGRLRAALLRLNPWLTEDGAERAIFKLETVDATGITRNRLVHEYLTYGMPLEVDERGTRRTRNVQFFDFERPGPEHGRNEFVVAEQVRVRRGNEREGRGEEAEDADERLVIPDLVLFVNGLPLVVIEAKAHTLVGDVWRARAVKQLQRYQEAGPEWQGRGAPELFAYNLMCVGISGAEAVYGAVGAPESGYARWKSIAPYSGDEVRERFGTEPLGQVELIVGLLAPATLLDVLRDYVVYEPEGGRVVKKLPRYQQYRAVTEAVRRILGGNTATERGGVVWHTQGSGKSLTMLWLATKLRREPRLHNSGIVIVTDRTQLDEQIGETFRRCGFPLPESAASTRKLRTLLEGVVGRTVLTTVQKFADVLPEIPPGGKPESLNDAENVIVMVDEAHRTQYGALAARMRAALSRAAFVGFTGTPIDQGMKRSTVREFGPLIDTYTIPEAVEDGATVPIVYEARLPELAIQGANTLDRLFGRMFGDEPKEVQERLKRWATSKEQLAQAEQRIRAIAEDVAEHYSTHVRPDGFKAQLAAPSRKAAVQYARWLRDLKVNAYAIIQKSADDEDAELLAAPDPAEQVDIIKRYLNPEGDPEILVVVDRLLTGFDAPVDQVLYLDRGLREHTLLQAIARVNRRCTVRRGGATNEKTYGLVIDYWGVSQELDEALRGFEPADVADAMKPVEADPALVIQAALRQALGYFGGRDIRDTWACVRVFEADEHTDDSYKRDLFEAFNRDYREVARLMDQYLPDPRALAFEGELVQLTKIRAYARSTFLREDTTVDWEGLTAKVKRLLDERLDADVRHLMKPVQIHDPQFREVVESLPHDEARASVIEHAIRAQISVKLDENPAFYEKLSEQLEAVIGEMRRRVVDAAETVRRLWPIFDQALSVADLARQQGLTEVSFAVYQLLEQAEQRADGDGRVLDAVLKEKALAIEGVLAKGQAIVDWERKDDVQRVMRRDVKRELRGLDGLGEEQLNELAAGMVEIARRVRTG